MKNSISMLLAIVLLNPASHVHADYFSDPQAVSKIIMDENGKMKVFSSENGGKWDMVGCYDRNYMVISSSTTAKEQLLSQLLMAKAMGKSVRFTTNSCDTTLSTTIVISIEVE